MGRSPSPAASRHGRIANLNGAGPDRLQPEEAVSVPIRAGDRLGDLRKAAVDAAIPGVPVVQDHDPLQMAIPFPDQQGCRAALKREIALVYERHCS
jgi:hypothetical protein